MGIIKSGILGEIQNQTGPVVARMHKGQNVITSRYKTKKTGEVSEKQQATRTRFSLLNEYLIAIQDLVDPGFKKFVKHNSPVNAAYSFNYDRAFTGEGEDLGLDRTKIMYSRGNVEVPESPQLVSEDGNFILSWSDVQQSQFCRNSDRLSFLIYVVEENSTSIFQNVCQRSELRYAVDAKEFAGKHFEVFASFASADGKLQGNSCYVGIVEIVGVFK
ncbi:MAG: hypothetical protein EOO92_09785 [Pedobacter sp.]|nr:MAG: hypothetical protein EOO92_09785 [Pedobacter sp.]